MTAPAGERAQYLTIWRESSVLPGASADTGKMLESYTKVCNVWGAVYEATAAGLASLMPLMHRKDKPAAPSGNEEVWKGFRIHSNASGAITIPYVEGIEQTDRITRQHRGRTITYNIAGPPLDLGGDLVILVNEVLEGSATT